MREHLSNLDSKNKEAFDIIDKALCVVALDPESPNSQEEAGKRLMGGMYSFLTLFTSELPSPLFSKK